MKPVGCNFVASFLYFADKMGKTFGKPAEDEESTTQFMCVSVVGCGLWVVGIKEIEKVVGVFFDPKLIG